MRPKATIDITNLVYGKVPPQVRDLEQIVLGVAMLEKTAFDRIATLLKAESFYVDAHQRVFRAMISLVQKSQPIDMLTVAEQLTKSEELDIVGGPYEIMKLTEKVTSSANLETYCQIIHEKYIKREQIKICAESLNEAYEDSSDAFEALDTLSAKVTGLAMIGTTEAPTDIATLGIERLMYLEEMRNRPEGEVVGVPSGFKSIDDVTNGWIDGDLIILAARPSVGKTALALNLARNAAAHPIKPTPVFFECLEMSREKLYDRLLSAETGIPLDKIVKGRLSDLDMIALRERGMELLSKYALELDYTASLNIIELRAKVRRWLQKVGGHGLVIIDYLQLMTGVRDDLKGQNRDQELANISRSLKNLAGELKIPVIALSQMSRDIEKRGGGKPKLADLRESGAIEQDADVVAFLAREDYEKADYEATEEEKDAATISFKKNRQGRLDTIPMRTVLEIQKWMEPEQYAIYQRNRQQFTPTGNWRPLEAEGPRLYIQSNSVMNGINENEPF